MKKQNNPQPKPIKEGFLNEIQNLRVIQEDRHHLHQLLQKNNFCLYVLAKCNNNNN